MKPIEMNGDCKFLQDLEIEPNVGGHNPALWNLITSIRDLKLYTKGIKPHRKWKISPVKKYFGMNGKPEVFFRKARNPQSNTKGKIMKTKLTPEQMEEALKVLLKAYVDMDGDAFSKHIFNKIKLSRVNREYILENFHRFQKSPSSQFAKSDFEHRKMMANGLIEFYNR